MHDNAGCNGENGHAEDIEDPITALNDDNFPASQEESTMAGNSNSKKKPRKSNAEKFLEDNTEYYGFQVLPSKLRSSSFENTTISVSAKTGSTTFLDYLHPSAKLKRQNRNSCQWGSNHRPSSLKTVVNGSSDTEAETDTEMGAGCTSVSKKDIKYSILF